MLPVRFGHLKLLGTKSPAHLRARLDEEAEGIEAPPSAVMNMGSATHSLILGGTPVVCYGGAVRRGKEWDAFQSANSGALILTASEYQRATGMAGAVEKHSEARDLLDGVREETLLFKLQGRECRATPDVRRPERVVDLKTTASADPSWFSRQAIRYAYHAQMAWYLDAAAAAGVGQPPEAYLVAVEATPPHPVTVLRLTPRALDLGRRLVRLWFERMLACEAANEWPGYVQSIVELDSPEDDELIYGDETLTEAA